MNWTRLNRIVAPTDAPLSVDDLKKHLAIAHSDEDNLIAEYIDVATNFIDGSRGAGVALLTQTYRLSLDYLPRNIELPIGPVQEIVSITVSGDELDPVSYDFDSDRTPSVIFCAAPSHTIKPGSVKITFVAGYGDDGDSIPSDLKHAIRLIVGHLYNNREAVCEVELKTVPMAVEAILSRYRVNAC